MYLFEYCQRHHHSTKEHDKKKWVREEKKNSCWHPMTCWPHGLPININISPGSYLGHLHSLISGCPLLSYRSLVTSSKDTFGARLSHPLLPLSLLHLPSTFVPVVPCSPFTVNISEWAASPVLLTSQISDKDAIEVYVYLSFCKKNRASAFATVLLLQAFVYLFYWSYLNCKE